MIKEIEDKLEFCKCTEMLLNRKKIIAKLYIIVNTLFYFFDGFGIFDAASGRARRIFF